MNITFLLHFVTIKLPKLNILFGYKHFNSISHMVHYPHFYHQIIFLMRNTITVHHLSTDLSTSTQKEYLDAPLKQFTASHLQERPILKEVLVDIFYIFKEKLWTEEPFFLSHVALSGDETEYNAQESAMQTTNRRFLLMLRF